MKINYHGRKFTGITNSPNGQVSGDTVFCYEQDGKILNATYHGGSILRGHMLGLVDEESCLHFVYHHLDINETLKGGYCSSIPEVLPDGRIRLHEKWEWTHGGEGEGESVLEETK